MENPLRSASIPSGCDYVKDGANRSFDEGVKTTVRP